MNKYVNIFGNEKYKDFAYIKAMCEEIEQTFNEKFLALYSTDSTFEARKNSINMERAENLDALGSMNKHKKKKKKNNQKCKFFDIDKKIENTIKFKTTKMVIDFNCLESASIQSFVIKKK